MNDHKSILWKYDFLDKIKLFCTIQFLMIYLRHHTLSRDICVLVVFYYDLSILYGRPIAMTIPHFKVAKGSKGITTSLFCLNNRMPPKKLICHLFARTVKCCVDTELFLVKMQKKCQISPTLANWPLAWLAGATQGRLKNSPIFQGVYLVL